MPRLFADHVHPNDRGYAVQGEIYSPDVARTIGLPDPFRLRGLAFVDYGAVTRNHPLPSEANTPTAHSELASTGLGLRLSYGTLVSLRFDVADILQTTTNVDKGSVRLSAALTVVF